MLSKSFLSRPWLFLPLAVLGISLLFLQGCRFETDTEEESTEGVLNSTADSGELTGIWLFKTFIRDQQLNVFLLEIKQDGTATKVGIKEMAPSRIPFTVKEISYNKPEFVLTLSDSKGPVIFKGKLRDEVIRGVTRMSNGDFAQSVLEKTALTSLAGMGDITEVNEAQDFNKASGSTDPVAGLNEFIEKHPDSHLVFKAHEGIVDFNISQKKPVADVEQQFDRWIAFSQEWGTEFQPLMYAKTISLLGNMGYPLELIEKLEKQFQDSGKKFTDEEALQVSYGKSLAKLNSTDFELQEKGVAELYAQYEKKPLETFILYRIISHYFINQNWEQVLKKSVAFLAIPPLEQSLNHMQENFPGYTPPSVLFLTAWDKLKKPHTEINQYIENEFPEVLKLYAERKATQESTEVPEHPVLIELHTSISNPNCIAIELAIARLIQKYGKDKVHVVRFHQNYPEGDPLTQREGELRFKFLATAYRLKPDETPIVIVNGQQVADVSGTLEKLPEILEKLQTSVLKHGKDTFPFDFTIKCDVEGDIIKTKITGDKLPEEFSELKPRFHLILVENEINIFSPNGLSKNSMIARSLPFGAMGRPFTSELNELNQEFDLNYIRATQEEFLQQFEKQKEGKFGSHPLDLNKLTLVAFLQSYATGEVLQFKVIDIPGEFGKKAPAPTSPDSNPPQKPESGNLPPPPNLPE